MYIIYIILYIGLSIKNCGCAQTFNGNPNAGILMDFGVGYFQTHPNDFGMDQKIGTLCWVLKWILLHGELGRIISVPLSWYSSTKGYHRNYILCDCKSRSEIEGWIHFIGRYYIYIWYLHLFLLAVIYHQSCFSWLCNVELVELGPYGCNQSNKLWNSSNMKLCVEFNIPPT